MRALIALLAAVAALPTAAFAQVPPQVVPVQKLDAAPTIDGALGDWASGTWTRIKVEPAVAAADRPKFGLDPQDRNMTGSRTVELKAGVAGDRFFVAARWPDEQADTQYKGWEWLGERYTEGKQRDDAFALRLHMGGSYDRSMLSSKTYQVDVWFWSSARTNPVGYAEDWTHQISTNMIEDAAEYEVKGIGTVYVKKIRDAGTGVYKIVPRPAKRTADHLESFTLNREPTGSVADVRAKGRWAGGKWSLEFARELNTGNPDDMSLAPGKKVLGQIAVFNRGSDENKSVSEPLLFDFSALQ